MAEEMKRKKKSEEQEVSSRLIVFNIPKYITEKKLADHFRQKGQVTDCKIMRKENKSRKFAFIGFKDEKEAKNAKDYYNQTYIDTCKWSAIGLSPNLLEYSSNHCGVCQDPARSKPSKRVVQVHKR